MKKLVRWRRVQSLGIVFVLISKFGFVGDNECHIWSLGGHGMSSFQS